MQPAPEFTGAMAAVRVLLIEDDPDFAALVRRCVASLGALPMLTTAETLQQAHEALQTHVYDLILADLGLPDSTGVATVHSIAEVSQRPIIVLTANEEPGIRDDSLAAGAYELLHKSDFDARVFTRLVRLAAIQGRTVPLLRGSEARFRNPVGLS